MTYHYVWLGWASGFLLPWLALYVTNRRLRPVMWRVAVNALMLKRTRFARITR